MRTCTIILLLIVYCSYGFESFAQTAESPKDKPYIEVYGTAEKEVIPNMIYIWIKITDRAEGKKQISVETQEDSLKQRLAANDIDLSHLSLSDANADFVRIGRRKKDVVSSAEYMLFVKTAEEVATVFNILDELKIQDARIQHVDHDEIQEIRKEQRILAIKAAKEKADYLLQAINEETGKPLIVREEIGRRSNLSNNIIAQSVSREYRLESDKDKATLQFRKIKVKISVYVKFEIK